MKFTKQQILSGLRTVAFLLVFGLMLGLVQRLALASHDVNGTQTSAVYHSPDGQRLDVAFFGSSHGQDAFFPETLYREYGLTSYNFSTQGQSLENTYWVLKEVLEHQQPRVVVVESFLFSWPYNWTGRSSSLFWTGGVRDLLSDISPNKWRAAKELKAEYPAYDEFFRLPTYRYEWKNLNRQKLLHLRRNYVEDLTFGANYSTDTWDMEADPWLDHDTGYDLSLVILDEKMVTIMDRIMDLTAQYDTQLIFAVSPYKTIDQEDECYRQMVERCTPRGVLFWNGVEQAGADWDYSAYQADRGHLNTTGGTLTTRMFGEYLRDTVGLSENRSAAWDALLARREEAQNAAALSHCATLDEFLAGAAALSEEYALLLNADTGADGQLTSEQVEMLRGMGFPDFAVTSQYSGLYAKGKLWQTTDGSTLDVLFNNSSFTLETGSLLEEEPTSGSITLDRETCCADGYLRLAIYSIEQADIVAAFVCRADES